MNATQNTVPILKYQRENWVRLNGSVIVEKSLSLFVNGAAFVQLMCTPKDLEAMAAGFLYNENIIQSTDEIEVLDVCPTGDQVDIWLNHGIDTSLNWRKTSGCSGGITSVTNYPRYAGEMSTTQLEPRQISQLMSLFLQSQTIYQESGGIHSSALSDGSSILLQTEDVGRHNTLDKIAGRMLLGHLESPIRILLTTGRISSDMVQKAYRIGAFMLISRTAANSMAVKMAQEWGMTLIGYTRREEFIAYTHQARISGAVLPESDSRSSELPAD